MVVIMHEDAQSESNGSFVDSHRKQTIPTVSFFQALHEKYIDQESFDDQIIIPKDKTISTDITFVGFGKVSNVQRQLKNITSIDLSGRNISAAGEIHQLKGALDRVTVLNIADNKLTWQEIIDILDCLPNLKEIIITANNLKGCPARYPHQCFKKLTLLALGRIDLNWSAIVKMVSLIWSSVERIDLWDNHLDEASMRISNYDHFTSMIHEMRLSQNNFTNLEWLVNAGTMSSLRELDLSRCKVNDITIEGVTLLQLERLETLNISYNNVRNWKGISNLNRIPNLTVLICNDNPFFNAEKLAKSFVVARLRKLRFLNREEISKDMRRDSEILYLRRTFPEYKSLKEGKSTEFHELHPRYEELIELYGMPEDPSDKKVEKYVTVNLCHGGKRVNKKLPRDIRVSNLQMLCKRLFRLKPSCRVEILCCAAGDESTSYPLDKEGQTLHFFSVKDNDDLLIQVH